MRQVAGIIRKHSHFPAGFETLHQSGVAAIFGRGRPFRPQHNRFSAP